MRAERHNPWLVLAPVGRITHLEADDFERDLMAQVHVCQREGGRILLDMQDVEYMSSAGLRVLMLAHKALGGARESLVLTNLNPTMAEIIEISRFDRILATFLTPADAMASQDTRAGRPAQAPGGG